MSDWSHLLSGGEYSLASGHVWLFLCSHTVEKLFQNWKIQLGEAAAKVSETGLGGEQTPWTELRLLGGLCSSYAYGGRENRNRLETGRGHWC